MNLQISGTAIGTKIATSYAIICMLMVESSILSKSNLTPPHAVAVHWRYFLYLPHGEENLLTFIDFINSAHLTFQFTAHNSPNEIDILDVKIKLDENRAFTTNRFT